MKALFRRLTCGADARSRAKNTNQGDWKPHRLRPSVPTNTEIDNRRAARCSANNRPTSDGFGSALSW